MNSYKAAILDNTRCCALYEKRIHAVGMNLLWIVRTIVNAWRWL